MRGRVCNAVGSLSCALISSRQRTSAFSPSRQWPLILLICMVNEHWPVTAGSHKSASAAPYVACLSAQRLACSAALSVTYSIRRSSRRVRALPRTGAAQWLFVSRELRRRGQFSSLVVVLLVTSRDKQNEVPMMVNTICTSRLRPVFGSSWPWSFFMSDGLSVLIISSSSSSYICSKRQHTAKEKLVSRTDRHKVHLHLP